MISGLVSIFNLARKIIGWIGLVIGVGILLIVGIGAIFSRDSSAMLVQLLPGVFGLFVFSKMYTGVFGGFRTAARLWLKRHAEDRADRLA